MGCDIHFYVEVLGKDGVWAPPADHIVNCDNCKGTGEDPDESRCANCGNTEESHEKRTKKCFFGPTKMQMVPVPCRWGCLEGKTVADVLYSGRSYQLFGVLSGVRGEPVEDFTDESCSLPDDTSPILRRISGLDDDSTDYHSHSSFLLTDLLKFDWEANGLDHFQNTLGEMQKFHKDSDCVRAIFWYDN